MKNFQGKVFDLVSTWYGNAIAMSNDSVRILLLGRVGNEFVADIPIVPSTRARQVPSHDWSTGASA